MDERAEPKPGSQKRMLFEVSGNGKPRLGVPCPGYVLLQRRKLFQIRERQETVTLAIFFI